MKRKWGDRKDGKLVRNLDGIHFIMPHIYPGRCDNEAFISEVIDLTKTVEYIDKKNAANPEYKYNLFQVIVASVLKTITLRPKLNQFICNKNYYQRNEITASFIVKKLFADDGAEALAFLHAEEDDNIDTLHNKIYKIVSKCRKDNTGSSTDDALDIFNKMPRFISRAAIRFICFLDKHGWVPQSFVSDDPYYASVILSNLGSIKLHAGYHHLTNWGTTSVFVIIGQMKKRAFADEDGNVTMKMSVDLGLTLDERIGDGYYFSKSVRLLRKLIENPELLECDLGEEVEY